MALIPPSSPSYPMWTVSGMVLAHGPHPTIALISDMAIMAEHMYMINDAKSRPDQGCHIGYECMVG